jgi:hypothetical protein
MGWSASGRTSPREVRLPAHLLEGLLEPMPLRVPVHEHVVGAPEMPRDGKRGRESAWRHPTACSFIIISTTRGGLPQYIGMKWSAFTAMPFLVLRSPSSAMYTHCAG